MVIQNLSKLYSVRKLEKKDVNTIFDIMCGNDIFFQHHPPLPTKESIVEDMEALPPGKGSEDKFYIGFFDNDQLIAVMDLILGYPKDEFAFIGFFMTNKSVQGRGVGTDIITDCLSYLSQCGYRRGRLGIDKGNPQSEAFWTKNGFVKTGEESEGDVSVYVLMEKAL